MEQDIDIHSILGPDTYGVIKVEWKESDTVPLMGRLSQYRLDSDGINFDELMIRQDYYKNEEHICNLELKNK